MEFLGLLCMNTQGTFLRAAQKMERTDNFFFTLKGFVPENIWGQIISVFNDLKLSGFMTFLKNVFFQVIHNWQAMYLCES